MERGRDALNLLARIGAILRDLLANPKARYQAAEWSTSRSYLPTTYQPARLDISSATRQTLQAKSRFFERNNGIYNKLVDCFECYVVGAGQPFQPSTSSQEYNQRAKDWVSTWAKYPDLITRQGLATLQAQAARAWFVDGECFILLTEGRDSSGRIWPRVQLVEADRCSTPDSRKKDEGTSIVDGVELDSVGQPIAYWISTQSGNEKKWTQYPANTVVHLFEPSRPGQYRGIPFITAALNDLQDLEELQILEMGAAKEAASVYNVIKNSTGEVSKRSLTKEKFSISKANKDGATVTEDRGQYYAQAMGGRTVVMHRDDVLEQFRSDRPNVASREYWKYLTEKICAAVGIPYVMVFPDSMQGTVFRGAMDAAAVFFKSRAAVSADAWVRVYEYVLAWANSKDRSMAPVPPDWYRVNVYSPRAVNVDVGRNSSAMLAELKAGATNWELIYAPLGLDWREQLRKRAEQVAYVNQLAQEFQVQPSDISDAIIPAAPEPQPPAIP